MTRDRRTWVVDAERGLVVDFAILDVANEEGLSAEARAQEPAASTGAYSLLAATLYKMAGDSASVAASATLVAPYGMVPASLGGDAVARADGDVARVQ